MNIFVSNSGGRICSKSNLTGLTRRLKSLKAVGDFELEGWPLMDEEDDDFDFVLYEDFDFDDAFLDLEAFDFLGVVYSSRLRGF